MDKNTQQNAAGAEESASTSEEMNAQAEQMKGFVAELIQLVRGGRDESGKKHPSVNSRSEEIDTNEAYLLPQPEKTRSRSNT
jgi:methyl-accepting chemotaxis protein